MPKNFSLFQMNFIYLLCMKHMRARVWLIKEALTDPMLTESVIDGLKYFNMCPVGLWSSWVP